MTDLRSPVAAGAPTRPLRVAAVVVGAVAAVAALAAVHLTQGTADVGPLDLVRLLTGADDEQAAAVVVASRIPRLLTGLLAGVALGMAGAALQSVARNPLAAPDTLGVDAGAWVGLVIAGVLGVALPAPFAGAVAFVGGLAAAALVLALAGGAGSGPTRLVLAGSAVALALSSLTITLLLLFREETVGLYAWSGGSLGQYTTSSLLWMGPIVGVGAVALLAISGRLDVHGLGDDASAVLGLNPQRTRSLVVVLAVLLSAASVTVAGPLGFVGLAAPALVRLLAPRVPGLMRHRALLPVSALSGVVVVLGSDIVVRYALGSQVGGVEVPTGVVTSIVGAGFLVVLAGRFRRAGRPRQAPAAHGSRMRSRRGFLVVLAVAGVATASAAFGGLLLGDAMLLGGDLVNRLTGRAGPVVTYVLDARAPRVLAALVAGAALAVAGAMLQAVCRNPLAEPGIIGVTGGAGVGAVLVITFVPTAGAAAIGGAAFAGAAVAMLIVFGLAVRTGLDSDRLVLIGVGMSYGTLAMITFIIVVSDPWNIAKALTWLSGSTYGRTFSQVLPVLLVLALAAVLMRAGHRTLDLVAVDEDLPRIVGVRTDRSRPLLLGLACLLTAAAVCAVGVISFVGLVAPHAARALVGPRHSRVLPVAALLGALLVCVADTIGRTVIAPAQLPAGLLAALIGTPYFVYLLWRSRATR
ncbi:iron ABC transporter permease [Pseudonocardia endophytica]|uniref:Iron complex transport system permease protein n=1 Tax=Pseudonocardia endophytica TaxID=401976 RepID=A0A4R1HMK4_PSEEN|nr:iron ABC transporter permease [Pseudonocardia endophytica]TCK21560.1 iron complex transport system permease protein [Pseudonocardia endophytica]